MGIFDTILGQAKNNPTVANMAEKLGIDADKAAEAVAALGEAHQQPGDTVELASAKTGLDSGVLNQIKDHIGGEGSLGKFASMLDKDGDGNPLNDITGLVGGLFGKK